MNDPTTIIKACANGNPAAESMMKAIWNFAHMLDDLVDRDHQVEDDDVVRKSLEMLIHSSSNPIWQEHRDAYLALFLLSGAAWSDSNREPNPEKAAVLKGMYHEMFYLTACYAGGPEHMRKVQREFREYDVEKDGG